MNLSDLVHRTAGDNNKALNNSNNSTRSLLPQQPSNLFQQAATPSTDLTANGAATANVNNVFASLNRQDQTAFLFSMPNLSQTDWMNSNLLFDSATDNFIDPTIPNSNPLSPNTNNSFLNQNLSFLNPLPPQQQQQRTHQPPTIAPYPAAQQQQQQQNVLTQNNRSDLNANATTSTMAPATPTNAAAVTTLINTTVNKGLGSAETTTLINHNASSPITSNVAAINFNSNLSRKASPTASSINSPTNANAMKYEKSAPNNTSRINFNHSSPPNTSLTFNRTPPTSTLNFSNSNSPTTTKPLQFNFNNSPSPSVTFNTQPSFIKTNSTSPAASSALQFNSNSATNASTTSIKTPPSVPLLLKMTTTLSRSTTTIPTNKPTTTPPSASTNFHNHSVNSATSKQPADQASSTTKSPKNDTSPALAPAPQLSTQRLFLEKKKVKLTVTKDNVNANNIEDGYIQFVLNHDPDYISDGIDSLIHAKRKFSSVPKTGDISYTTWDIYQLVLRLHKRQIKNWSQLVGQLGLADMAGRPQFAQRVKRWMHRYKIDCYFDYLLGNEYDFHAANENYSGCLMMGNHKKKKLDHGEESAGTSASHTGGGTESEEESHDVAENKIPILLAGSRKRMRDQSQNSQQLIENARQFLRKQSDSSSEEEDEEEDEIMLDEEEEKLHVKKEMMESSDSDDDDDDEVIVPKINGTMHQPSNDMDEEMENVEEEEDEEEVDDDEEEVDDDEEDELASTSSSPGSPAAINSSPKLVATIPTKPSPQISAPLPLITNATTTATSTTQTTPTLSNGGTETPSCISCSSHETTISEMRKEISRLNAYIKTLEATVDQQTSMTSQMNKLLRLRDRTERWRKQLIEDLARGPPQLSDEDDLGETDDDDDGTTQSTTTDVNGSSGAL